MNYFFIGKYFATDFPLIYQNWEQKLYYSAFNAKTNAKCDVLASIYHYGDYVFQYFFQFIHSIEV